MSLASAIRAALPGGPDKKLAAAALAAVAEDEKDPAKAAMPEAEPEDDEDKKAAEKPAAEPDDAPDEDEPEDEKETGASARAGERARIGAITGHASADRLPSLAAHLAYQTGLSAKASAAILDAAAKDAGPAKTGLAERMAGKVPALGAGEHKASTENSLAAAASNRFGQNKARSAKKGA